MTIKTGMNGIKKFLFSILILLSTLFSAQATVCDIELYQEEVDALLNFDKEYVLIGNDGKIIVETLRALLDRAHSGDVVVNMRNVIERAERGYQVIHKNILQQALEQEARVILEKRYIAIDQDDFARQVACDYEKVCGLVASDAFTVTSLQTHESDANGVRNCSTSKTFCRITVMGSAVLGSLHVLGNTTMDGTLRVQGVSVGGDTCLNGLMVQGSSIHTSIRVLGTAIVGSLIVGEREFTDAFMQGGNSFGEPALLGTNDGQPLNIETSGVQRMQISNAGAVAIAAPTAGIALTVDAGTNALGLVVQGNGTARAATITAGNNTGGGLLIMSGTGSGVPLEVTAATGQGNAATFIGNDNAATAVTITPGINRVGLTIEDSGTAAGLKVFSSMQLNANNLYPLFAGGTQVVPGTFVPGLGQTNTPYTGTPRIIWASVSADGLTVSQSGGILTVGHTGPGVYPITYSTFGSISPMVLVSAGPTEGFFANTSVPTPTGVTIRTSTNVLGTLTLTDADFSILIIGLAN